MQLLDTDIELFRNYFVIKLNDKVFELYKTPHSEINQIKEFRKFMRSDRMIVVCHNGLGYDFPLIQFILNTKMTNTERLLKKLYNYGKQLIGQEFKPQINYEFIGIDTMEVLRKNKNRKSLKSLGINLKYHTIQDLPVNPNDIITDSLRDGILSYLNHDINLLREVRKAISNKLKMRNILSKKYKTNLYSASDSSITDRLLDKFMYDKLASKYPNIEPSDFKKLRTYRGDITIGDVVFDWVKFEDPELQKFFEFFKTRKAFATDDKHILGTYDESIPYTRRSLSRGNKGVLACYVLDYKGVTYKLGIGGIHSEDGPLWTEANEDYYLIDIDVASFYPRNALNNGICPAHVDREIFFELFNEIVEERLKYKALKNENPVYDDLQNGLKILINTALFGKFSSRFYWLYDPLCHMQMTINCQMALLMLIEKVNKFAVLSANTDGIVCKVPINKYEEFKSLYQEWEKATGFDLEETYYKKIIRNNVNNYITELTNGKLKQKGATFMDNPFKDLMASVSAPVVALAIKNFFLENKPVEETIKNHKDLHDFCYGPKIDKKKFYNVLIDGGTEQKVQDTVRFYASDKVNTSLIKRRYEGGDYSHMAESNIQLFNQEFDGPEPDYEFYINKAYEVINKLEFIPIEQL